MQPQLSALDIRNLATIMHKASTQRLYKKKGRLLLYIYTALTKTGESSQPPGHPRHAARLQNAQLS